MKVKKFVACLSAIALGALCAFTTACTPTTPNDNDNGGGGEIVTPSDVAVTGVKFTETSVSMKVNDKKSLAYSVLPANATDKKVSFSSSNPNVVQVADGVVTAKAGGTATITVTTNDGGFTAQCIVTVTDDQTPVKEYTVSFDMQGKGTQQPEQKVASGGKATKPNNPTDANYDFKGWFKEAACENEFNFTTETITADVTVYAKWEKKTVAVTGLTMSKKTAELEVGGSLVLTASVTPQNATSTEISWSSSNTNVATVSGGTVTAKAAGTTTITAAVGSVKATCSITVKEKQPETPPEVTGELTFSYAHSGNESAAFEWSDTAAKSASVQYKLSSEGVSGYKKADAQLVRQKDSGTARADVVGLKGGETYDFLVTSSDGKQATVSGVSIESYDRSGYAHFNYSGVGAYNNDGTLKSGANVVYVTEETKNTVTATIDGKKYTGLVSILQNAGTKTPLVLRILGTVGAATWNKLEHNGGKALTPDKIIGKNEQSLLTYYENKGSLAQADLIKNGFNTLNTTVYDELIGLSSKAKYDSDKNEFDSCWNDCSVSGVKNVTVEGIGEDARIFQWGMTFRSCESIEVRNLTFEDYTEDACSFEGGKSEDSSATPNDFKTKRFWVHHNTFEEGMNYWDICNEQDKHDGDGSTDFKYLAYATLSYNQYNATHKTGLIGGSNSNHTASVTFHHNYYNGCKSRLPMARQANMHMYNNFYHATTSSDISLRASAYALVENCYFDSTKSTQVELQHDSTNGDGAAKIINCHIDSSKIKLASGVSSSNKYVGTDRLAKVTNTNKYGTEFDTDSSLFYYDENTKSSKVESMLTAEQVKTLVPELAGVMKRKSNVSTGTGSGGSTTVTSVTLDKTSAQLKVGDSVTLTATVTPAGAATASFKSSDTSVATVTAGGEVLAKAAGTATITATAGGVSATCTVTVTASGSGESQTVVTHSFSYSKLVNVSGLEDTAALSQANFKDDNAFLIVGSGVTYRTKNACIENKGEGLKVEFEGTGEITITITSTGKTNVSRIGLKDKDGKYIAASSYDSGFTAVTDGEAGAYEMTGTTKLSITFTVNKAGVYTITCPSSVTKRGARIYAIEMTDRK